jgi:hypothetical protein
MVIKAQSPIAELLAKDPVLLAKVVNDLQLALIHPPWKRRAAESGMGRKLSGASKPIIVSTELWWYRRRLIRSSFRIIRPAKAVETACRKARRAGVDIPIATADFCYTDAREGHPEGPRPKCGTRDVLMALNVYTQPIPESVKHSVEALDTEFLKILGEIGQQSENSVQ